jgi:uncharacterized protein YydD (DUF2326 family)
MLVTTFKIHHWTSVSLKINKLKKSILVTNKKKNFFIDMMAYFVRKGRKHHSSIVLEAITEDINN